MELYTEKMHICEKGILRDIVMVIYKELMYFIFIDEGIEFIRPINMLENIDIVLECTMRKD